MTISVSEPVAVPPPWRIFPTVWIALVQVAVAVSHHTIAKISSSSMNAAAPAMTQSAVRLLVARHGWDEAGEAPGKGLSIVF